MTLLDIIDINLYDFKILIYPTDNYVSNIIKNYLDNLKLKNSLISLFDMQQDKSNIIYFISNSETIKQFPSRYIIYQTQVINDLTDQSFLNIVNNAFQYWDFSIHNIEQLKSYTKTELIYFPLPLIKIEPYISLQSTNKTIDVLLIGNNKRINIFTYLKKKYENIFNIKYIQNNKQQLLYKYINSSKVIVNLCNLFTDIINIINIHKCILCKTIPIYEENKLLIEYNNHFYNNQLHLIKQIEPNLINIQPLCDTIESVLQNNNEYINKNIQLLKNNNINNINNINKQHNKSIDLSHNPVLNKSINSQQPHPQPKSQPHPQPKSQPIQQQQPHPQPLQSQPQPHPQPLQSLPLQSLPQQSPQPQQLEEPVHINKLTIDNLPTKPVYNKIGKYIFKLYSSNFSSYIIEMLSYFFNKLELNYTIVNQINLIDDNNEYIIYILPFCQNIRKMPKKYIVIQLEQIGISKQVSQLYLNQIRNSLQCWDYSIRNIQKLPNNCNKKSIYVPIPLKLTSETTDETIDVLFYGLPNSRRTSIINHLINKYSNKYNILYPKNCYGEDLYNYIKQSKIVLNLNYYENANLATYRINEILSYNKLVISERGNSEDSYNNKYYSNQVIFIETISNNLENIKILCNQIEFYLENPTRYNQFIDKNKQFIKQYENYYLPFIQKALISLNIYSYENYKIKLTDSMYCLKLIERPDRYKLFIQQGKINIPTLTYFDGIKQDNGWMGCGMSYRQIIYNAHIQNMNYITICEDDCLFHSSFKSNYEIIINYLQQHMNEWDIVVGLVAAYNNALHPTISNIIQLENGILLVEVSKFVSGVCNIYNKSSYESFLNWDSTNNSKRNMFDRYLCDKCNLKVLVCFPFIVNCIADSKSTQWGDKSNQALYSRMIQKSISYFKPLINNYAKTHNMNISV